MPNVDYYSILQIIPQADSEVIQVVYRRLARKYHPDANGDADKMKLLNEAYAVLSDPKQRAAYDKTYKPVVAVKRAPLAKTLLYQSHLYRQRESWLDSSDDYCETEQRGGYFRMVITKPSHTSYKVLPTPLTNLQVKVKLSLPRGSNGKDAECGIVFRKSDLGFYKFSVHRDAHYSFSVCYKGKWSRLIDRQHSDLFGDGTEHVITARAMARKIKLKINGEIVATLIDDKLVEGRVGIFAGTGEGEALATAKFKDFFVYQIRNSKIKD